MNLRPVSAAECEAYVPLFRDQVTRQRLGMAFESAVDQLDPVLLAHQQLLSRAGFVALGLHMIELMLREIGEDEEPLVRHALAEAVQRGWLRLEKPARAGGGAPHG